MKFQITYNTTTRTVVVQDFEDAVPAGASIIGFFTHDDVGNPSGVGNNDTVYFYVQQALNAIGVTDMLNVAITTTATGAPVGYPYSTASAKAYYDVSGNLLGLIDKKGALVPLGGETSTNHTGTLAELMDLTTAKPGDLGIPDDAGGIVVYRGEDAVAQYIPRLDSPDTLGADSVAIGFEASTEATASKSIAVGAYAKAHAIGEICIGSAKVGVRRSILTGYVHTTSASGKFAGPEGEGAFSLPAKMGLYRIKATFMVREGWTDNFAMFTRHAVLLVNEDLTLNSVLNTVTPEPDFNSNLAGCTVSLMANVGPTLGARVVGLAGRNLDWSVFIEVQSMTEEVL